MSKDKERIIRKLYSNGVLFICLVINFIFVVGCSLYHVSLLLTFLKYKSEATPLVLGPCLIIPSELSLFFDPSQSQYFWFRKNVMECFSGLLIKE